MLSVLLEPTLRGQWDVGSMEDTEMGRITISKDGDGGFQVRECDQKREIDGKYAFDGNLERMCVCGHTLARHAAGSPADCLFYSLPEYERHGQPGADNPRFGCQKFRLSRKKSK